MITLTRLLARQFRAVSRRALALSSRGQQNSAIVVETGPEGLSLRAQSPSAAIEYRQPGPLPAEHLIAPYMLLVDAEGMKPTPLTVECRPDKRLVCQWQEKQVPALVTYDPPEFPNMVFPALPANLTPNEPGLIAALDDAMQTTDAAPVRYATNCLQMRGARGDFVATEGHHILIQSGWTFPWSKELLVPRNTVFAAKELVQNDSVQIGSSPDWLTLVIGNWTIHLLLEKEGRYPRVDDMVRDPASAKSTLLVSPADARFLLENLGHLPVDRPEFEQPITLELNGAVAIRAQSEQQPVPTELRLVNSTYDGQPLLQNSDRRYLARSLKLGLRDILFFDNSPCVQSGDGRRTYIWALLNSDGAIAASEKFVRIDSPRDDAPVSTTSNTRNSVTMPKKKPTPSAAETSVETISAPTNGHTPHENSLPVHVNGAPHSNGVAQVSPQASESGEPAGTAIEQAIALREMLRSLLVQTTELIATLRRQKKQARLVATTVASLRQLQNVS